MNVLKTDEHDVLSYVQPGTLWGAIAYLVIFLALAMFLSKALREPVITSKLKNSKVRDFTVVTPSTYSGLDKTTNKFESRQAYTIEATLVLSDFIETQTFHEMAFETRQMTSSHLEVVIQNNQEYLKSTESCAGYSYARCYSINLLYFSVALVNIRRPENSVDL